MATLHGWKTEGYAFTMETHQEELLVKIATEAGKGYDFRQVIWWRPGHNNINALVLYQQIPELES